MKARLKVLFKTLPARFHVLIGVLRLQLTRLFTLTRQACWAGLEMRRRNVWKWRSFFPFLPLLLYGGRQLQRTLRRAAEGDKADWNETHSFKRYLSCERVAILRRSSRMDPGHPEFISIDTDPGGNLQVGSVPKVNSGGCLSFSLWPAVWIVGYFFLLATYNLVWFVIALRHDLVHT